MKFTYGLFVLALVHDSVCHQGSYMQIESENSRIVESQDIRPFLHLSVNNEMKCYMKCLKNQNKCCTAEFKKGFGRAGQCILYDISSIYLRTTYEKDSKIKPVLSRDCKVKPRNCLEWYQKGRKENGVYQIDVNPSNLTIVFCDMTRGGWTIFQNRFDGSVNFVRGWNDFKHVFGDIEGEYWLGNDLLYQLTDKPGGVLVKFDTTSLDDEYVIFNGFRVEDEKNNYKLHIGNAVEGDKHLVSVGQNHITDRLYIRNIYSQNCAALGFGAFWHRTCSPFTPNSGYPNRECDEYICMRWKNWKSGTLMTYANPRKCQ